MITLGAGAHNHRIRRQEIVASKPHSWRYGIPAHHDVTTRQADEMVHFGGQLGPGCRRETRVPCPNPLRVDHQAYERESNGQLMMTDINAEPVHVFCTVWRHKG